MPPNTRTRARNRSFTKQKGNFLHGNPKVEEDYYIYRRTDSRVDQPPDDSFGTVGDLYEDDDTKKVWLRDASDWVPAAKMNGGKGVQRHPIFTTITLWNNPTLGWRSHQGKKNTKEKTKTVPATGPISLEEEEHTRSAKRGASNAVYEAPPSKRMKPSAENNPKEAQTPALQTSITAENVNSDEHDAGAIDDKSTEKPAKHAMQTRATSKQLKGDMTTMHKDISINIEDNNFNGHKRGGNPSMGSTDDSVSASSRPRAHKKPDALEAHLEQSAISAENQWLLNAFNDWTRFADIRTASGRAGFNMLKAAMSRTSRIANMPALSRRQFLTKHSKRPTFAMFLTDLCAYPDDLPITVSDSMTGGHMSKESVMAAMMHHSAGYDVLSQLPLVGTFDVPGTPAGMGQCVMTAPRALIQRGGVYPLSATGDDIKTAFQAGGTVTFVHGDDNRCPVSTLPVDMLHEAGIYKIWFLAPPTKTNLALMKRSWFETDPGEEFTLKCIKEFEKLHYIIQYGPDAPGFILPPGWFHTVMTFRSSCHTGIRFVAPKYEEDAERMISWTLDHLDDLPNGERKDEILETLRNDLNWWSNTETTGDWVKKCEEQWEIWGQAQSEDE